MNKSEKRKKREKKDLQPGIKKNLLTWANFNSVGTLFHLCAAKQLTAASPCLV